MVVSEVNEAVKLVDGESLTGSLDRDGLWAVRGFLLDAAVLAALPEQVKDAADLIDLVVAAGFEWNVVSANLL